MKTLFLCFYGDSALWKNTLLIPGYPSGHSYYRPYRYRDRWVQPSLRTKILDEKARETLVGKEAILCMRFLADSWRWSVLPIRKAVIRHIGPMPNNYSVYFSMGPLYDFDKVGALSDVCLSIDTAERAEVDEALFFRANLAVRATECTGEAMENAAWVAFSDLVASETDVPLRDEAKRGLFVRFGGLSREQAAQQKVIHRSWSRGEMYGTVLSEGLSYELTFYHRVPMLLDQHTSLKTSLIKYKAPSGNLELSRFEDDLTGNYQEHVIDVTALRPSGAWEEVVIELPEEVESQDGRTVTTVNMHVPLKVKRSLCYRFKRTFIWLVAIWISLALNAIVGHRLDGSTDWGLMVASAIFPLLSAVAVYMLQQNSASR